LCIVFFVAVSMKLRCLLSQCAAWVVTQTGEDTRVCIGPGSSQPAHIAHGQ
jgi:hypothetical protein